MPESCPNCGAELYEGQQFCRRCGTPVGAAAGGEAPTQLFDGVAQSSAAQSGAAAPTAAGTLPLGAGARTEGVAAQRPTEYHPHAGQQTSALVGEPFGSRPLAVGATPAPRRRRGVWLFALLAVFMLGAGLATVAGLFWWRATHTTGTVVRVVKTSPPAPPVAPEVPPIPDVPAVPADLGKVIQEALKGHGVPLPLDEADAVVSGDDTILTHTFELDSDESFSTNIVNGNVTVVGSDDADEAVVRVIKHGGSVQERASTKVLAAESDAGVTLISAAAPGGRVSVSYEIKVPRRGLRKLQLSAQRGDIKVTEFDGELNLNVSNGNVSVASNGAVRSRVANGRTSVTYTGGQHEPQEFLVENGDLEVSLPGEPSVDLTVASTNGRIEVDDALPVKVEKRGSGYRAEARLGGGGGPLNVKVVNGNIRLKK